MKFYNPTQLETKLINGLLLQLSIDPGTSKEGNAAVCSWFDYNLFTNHPHGSEYTTTVIDNRFCPAIEVKIILVHEGVLDRLTHTLKPRSHIINVDTDSERELSKYNVSTIDYRPMSDDIDVDTMDLRYAFGFDVNDTTLGLEYPIQSIVVDMYNSPESDWVIVFQGSNRRIAIKCYNMHEDGDMKFMVGDKELTVEELITVFS